MDQLKIYWNLNLLANKLYGCAGYLANIEMLVSARLGLSWDEVLKYNPNFDGHRTPESYKKMVEFVESNKNKYKEIESELLKIVYKLDEVCDENRDSRIAFRKIKRKE